VKNKKNYYYIGALALVLIGILVYRFNLPEQEIRISEVKVPAQLVVQPPVKIQVVQKTEPPAPVQAPVAVAPPLKPAPAICNEPTNYNCMKKVFQPDVKEGEHVAYECVEIPATDKRDVQKYCMNIKVRSYNTRTAYSNCPSCKPADIEPGGRYHFEETVCVNEGFKIESGEDRLPLRHEGKALSDTFTQVYSYCLSYPEKPMGALAQGSAELVPIEDKGELK
jgi:hypothetical protein